MRVVWTITFDLPSRNHWKTPHSNKLRDNADERVVLDQMAISGTSMKQEGSGMAFQLDEKASQELQRISEDTKVSPEELVGIALRFMIMTADAHRHNRRILVTTPSGYPISELTIPRP
jgi:hypothetical protein